MRERQLRRLLDLKQDDRFPVIGEGLALLGEHVNGLAASVATLESAGDIRGAAALDIICTEEAAKILILLDMSGSMDVWKPADLGRIWRSQRFPKLIDRNQNRPHN